MLSRNGVMQKLKELIHGVRGGEAYWPALLPAFEAMTDAQLLAQYNLLDHIRADTRSSTLSAARRRFEQGRSDFLN
jgi:hypothetical protein